MRSSEASYCNAKREGFVRHTSRVNGQDRTVGLGSLHCRPGTSMGTGTMFPIMTMRCSDPKTITNKNVLDRYIGWRAVVVWSDRCGTKHGWAAQSQVELGVGARRDSDEDAEFVDGGSLYGTVCREGNERIGQMVLKRARGQDCGDALRARCWRRGFSKQSARMASHPLLLQALF